ncbi:hypothetical protein AB0G05_46920, partial [Nonomuraea wenchangensis]
MTDKRKVQTAVLSSRDSHEPIVMPFERADAILLRSRYSSRRFFCGEWLGGCGRELYTEPFSSSGGLSNAVVLEDGDGLAEVAGLGRA